ncbi:MAG: prolipoprotein diacylglyceryl transferase [Endomicrobiia bacterium]
MYPTLFKIGNIALRTYGLFVALGVLLAYNYVRYFGYKLKHIKQEFLSNFLFYTILIGFLGGRLFYVLFNFYYYKNNLIDIFKIWEGGLVFYGGFILGLIFGVFYVIINKQNLFDIMDISSSGLYLGLSVGRIGCFFAGCCYGKPTESILGVVFSHPESLAPTGIKLFPTQLFESFYSFLIFIFLHVLLQKQIFQKRLFFIGGIIYSIFRFLNEFLRGDDRGRFIYNLSPSQFISIVIFLLFLLLFFYITFKYKDGEDKIESRKNCLSSKNR